MVQNKGEIRAVLFKQELAVVVYVCYVRKTLKEIKCSGT